jgi:hypothetical protein
MKAEGEENCARRWCDANDKNKMLNITTTTNDNIFDALSHNLRWGGSWPAALHHNEGILICLGGIRF